MKYFTRDRGKSGKGNHNNSGCDCKVTPVRCFCHDVSQVRAVLPVLLDLFLSSVLELELELDTLDSAFVDWR